MCFASLSTQNLPTGVTRTPSAASLKSTPATLPNWARRSNSSESVPPEHSARCDVFKAAGGDKQY